MPQHIPLPAALANGPFTPAAARRHGVSARRLEGVDVRQAFHGIHRFADAPNDLEAQCRAYLLKMRPEQCFSHITAAIIWGVPISAEHRVIDRDTRLPPIHVSTPPPLRAPRGRGVRGYRFSRPDGSVVIRRGLPVADPASVWLQLARLLDHDDLVAAGDHLVLQPEFQAAGDLRPYVPLDELREACHRYIGPGKRHAARALRDVRQGAESRPETLLRLLLARAGLPEPELNPVLFDDDGNRIGRMDLVFREQRLVLEYDGDQHRTDSRQYDRDMLKLERLARASWHIVRIRKHALFETPHDILPRITPHFTRAP